MHVPNQGSNASNGNGGSMTALEQRLANDMADAATYYFKIQECGPKEPDTAYWRVRVKAKALLREAVDHWKLYQKERLQ